MCKMLCAIAAILFFISCSTTSNVTDHKTITIYDTVYRDTTIYNYHYRDTTIYNTHYKDSTILRLHYRDSTIYKYKDSTVYSYHTKDTTLYNYHHKDTTIYNYSYKDSVIIHYIPKDTTVLRFNYIDTIVYNITPKDTIILNKIFKDTLIHVPVVIHDTTVVHDTNRIHVTIRDTTWLHDTLRIHDTTYIHDTLNEFKSKIGLLPNSQFLSQVQKASIVKDSIGADYVRDAIVTTDFDKNGKSTSYETNRDKGLRIVCNINNGQQTSGVRPFMKASDTAAYKIIVDKIFLKYPDMELAVCENEPFNQNYFSGSMIDYCNNHLIPMTNVAHAHGIKAVDGGNYRITMEILAWRWFDSTKQFADRDSIQSCLAEFQIKAAKSKGFNADLEQRVTDNLLVLLTDKIYCDYVNLHIYQDANDTTQTSTKVSTALKYLQKYIKQFTGLEVITNETGQRNNIEPSIVSDLLSAYDNLNYPYALWFSGTGSAGATTLYDEKTGVLQDNGKAFRDYLKNRKVVEVR